MPLYEYQCEVCSHRFERIQKFSDPLIDVCPSCGGTVKKLLSSPAIQFKGSGWYITDYAKKSSSDGSSGKASSDKESGSSSETKSDSAKSDSAKSDSAKPDSAKSDSAKPDSTKAPATGTKEKN
jgi:putative FmdB family regulatory protein